MDSLRELTQSAGVRAVSPQSVSTTAGATVRSTLASPAHPLSVPGSATRSRWLGPFAGLAAGLGLSALSAQAGFTEEVAGLGLILLALSALAGAALLWRSRRQPSRRMVLAAAYADGAVGQEAMVAQQFLVAPNSETDRPRAPVVRPPRPSMSAAALRSGWHIPPELDVSAFECEARAHFLAMQSAHDEGSLERLREHTNPDMFARIRSEWSDREARPKTDLVSLEVSLLGMDSTGDERRACVRYRGQVREADTGQSIDFDEVWKLTRPLDQTAGWVLVSVQPLN